MASGLSIVIDTRNAELNIKNLNQALERLETQGNSIANMMRNLGGLNPFAGLTTSITSLKDSFNDFAGSTNTAKTAIKNLADGFTSAKTAIDNAEASLRQFNQTAGANGLGRLNGALTAANNSLNQTNNTIHNTQNNFTQLNNNVNLTRNSLTALSSVVTNNTTVINNYNQSLNHASASAGHANGAFEQLNRTLSRLQALATGGIMGGMLLSVAKTADAMQGLENQVRLVTQGEEQREEVQRRLLVIANKNFADIEATTGSYQRNAFALAQLGKSQMDVLNFTDALSLAMRTGGRSMVEQKSAVYQLSQAMGAGKLQGDEYKSIAENAPVLLSYIAKEMGVAQGALKELGSEGKITSEIIYNAMMKARPEMEKMAQSLPITMSQAWQQVNNSYKTFIDNFMNGTGGMSQGIASMLQGIGKNFDTVIKGMTIAGGLAFVGFASKIDIATKSMALFNFVANANPFVRMATIILAVSSAFYGLDDVINTTSVIMGDLIHMITDGWTGIFTLIGDGTDWLQGKTSQSNVDVEKSYTDMFSNVTTKQGAFYANAAFASNNLVKLISTNNLKNEQSYFGFYEKSQKGFLGFVEFVGTATIAVVSTLAGFFKYVANGIGDAIKQIGNGLMAAEEWVESKLGRNTKFKRYELTGLSAQEAVASINREVQALWHSKILDWAGAGSTQIPTTPTNLYNPIDPNAKPPSSSDINDKKKKAHDLLKGEIADAIQWAAADLKINPNDLAAVISFETRGTFSPAAKNPNSSATGLIQFMADKYKSYGYTRNEFAALGANEQMKYVVQYLKGRGIGQGSNLSDIYSAVAGWGYKKGTKAYELNRVWDANRDGYVAKGEAVKAKAFQPHIKNYFPNGINLQDVGKVETDLAKNQAALDKAREDYIASIATGEAKINAQLNKAIADLPSKGFSGQALEDEKKRLTEEAEFDRLLSRETNRQKLDELMGVHKTKKDQILDESYLQGLTIAADESKSREQRKTELEALDVGTKEKIRLNDIANKYELGKIWAFRKTSSELIADEWDEKIDALRQYTGEYKEEWRKAYEEQRKIALENDKLVNQQKLLDINVANLTEIDLIMKRAELEQKILDNTPNISPEMYNAQSADIKRKQANGVFDVREKSANNYLAMISGFHGLGKNYEANKAAEDNKKANFGILDSALQNGILSSEAQQKGITEYELYLERVKEINEKFKIDTEITLIGGYQSIFGGMADILKMFGGESRKSYMMLLAAQKGYVLQAAFLNNKKAISDAWATDGNYFTKAIAVGKVILQNEEIMSAITSFSPKGFSTGGYTGNMGVNDIAGVVHGKEYVLNAAATKRIGVDNLNAMNKGGSVGTKVIVNNYSNENATVEKQDNGDIMVTIGKMIDDVTDYKIEKRFAKASRQGWNIGR